MPRGTKRPLNRCKDCGHTFYPRGHNLAPSCPQCGSRNVTLAYLWGCVALAVIVFVLWAISKLSGG